MNQRKHSITVVVYVRIFDFGVTRSKGEMVVGGLDGSKEFWKVPVVLVVMQIRRMAKLNANPNSNLN